MLQIDLEDPQVRRLMGRPPERELVQLAGDAPDPTGVGPNGQTTTYHLNRAAAAHPLVEYHIDRVDYALLECDVYAHPGEPVVVHLICPRCKHALSISAERKDIAFSPTGGLKGAGELSIEAFECTWELPGTGKHIPGLVGGGMSLCKWRVAIENNVAKDA